MADVGQQGLPVALDGKGMVGATVEEAGGQFPLRQHGTCGEDAPADVGQHVDQGNDGADFVGAFLLVVRPRPHSDFSLAYDFLVSWPTMPMTWVCTPSASTAPRMVLPSMAKRTVLSAVVFVPLPQGGVEGVRADPDQHVADDRPARWYVPALVEARPEIRQHRLALIMDPLRDLLVAAHAGKRRGGGEREHRRQAVPQPLPAPRVLHLAEVIGQGTHLCSGECHLRNSLVQAGIEVGRPQTGPRIAAQWIEKDKLGPAMDGVAALPMRANPRVCPTSSQLAAR